MKNIFIEKSIRKWAAKAIPRPLYNLIYNQKQPLHARNYFKIRYFETGLSKILKKVISFFLSNPVPFNR